MRHARRGGWPEGGDDGRRAVARAARRACEWSVGVADLHKEEIKRIGYARPSIATRPPNPMPPDPGSARFGERAF
ncbi:hypothetical protein BOC40_07785 [Burkholderia pseudomallei]|nr:hypothetical protein BOC40_07785 [Burkholderia pseudomallei]ARL46082.1 hypothetical protein BOC50_24115 [Burkholderia pseudomallei]